jgi:Ca-activated chloride channel family protein
MNAVRTLTHWLFVALWALLVNVMGQPAVAEAAGLLTPVDGSLPELQIRDHRVGVTIDAGYATVSVDQVFHNPHDRDLEAVYSFPVPDHATVSEFTYWIDGKPVHGEILEKKEGRKAYAEEKAAGRQAGIAEKDAHRVFEVRVTPVRAGQDVRIRLGYIQAAHVDTGIGRFLYPLEEGGVDDKKLAFWKANETVTGTMSFDLTLRSGYPVEAVRVPDRPDAGITQVEPGLWRVHIGQSAQTAAARDEAEGKAPPPAGWTPTPQAQPQTLGKDIVVYWRLAQNLPGSVDMIAYKRDAAAPGTFLLTITPGDDLSPITEGRDWVFVLDISGSMNGKYATLAEGVRKALSGMRQGDRFRLVTFNDSATELTPGFIPVTKENVAQWADNVAAIRPQRGTNLHAGLSLGLSALDADRTGAVVLVTDGEANVGETSLRAMLSLLEKKDARIFTCVLGNSANRPLLEALTKASSGFAITVSNADDIAGRLLQAVSKVSHHALHGARVEIDGVRVADLTPETIGSLYRGQQLVLLGRYHGHGEATVRLRGRVGGQEKVYQTRFAFPQTATADPELERLWAYGRIEEIQQEMERFGDKADLRQAVVDLSKQYGLVTDHTAMVVMREESFAARKIDRTNAARLADEAAARARRDAAPTRSTRVDTTAPISTATRPTLGGNGGSGGGAWDIWSLAALLPLAASGMCRLRRRGK